MTNQTKTRQRIAQEIKKHIFVNHSFTKATLRLHLEIGIIQLNMKLATFLFLYLSCILVATAQSDFKPGYIITLEEDTIYGTLDLRSNQTMHTKCDFITEGDNVTTTYLPEEILAYRFTDGKYYTSKEIDNSMIFLEFLLEGEINLYIISDNGADIYYIEKENTIIELPYSSEIIENENGIYEQHSTRHIGIMKYYMNDAPQLNSKIENLKTPDRRGLIKLTKDYHDITCDGETCIIYEKSKSKFKVDFNLATGMGFYKNSIDKNLKYSTQVYGLTADVFLTNTSEKFFIRIGVMHHRAVSKDKGTVHIYKEGTVKFRTTVPDSDTYFPLQLGYKFPREYRIRPAIALSLLNPIITPSVDIRVSDKLSLGIQSWLMYHTSKASYYSRNSVLASVSYKL